MLSRIYGVVNLQIIFLKSKCAVAEQKIKDEQNMLIKNM